MIVYDEKGHEIDTKRHKYWRYVEGWAPENRDQGGANNISGKKWHDRFMCVKCMERRRLGLSETQESLL